MLVSVPSPYNYMLGSLADFWNQDMSGKYLSSRTRILILFMLTDNPLDTQGEVSRPSKVVLQRASVYSSSVFPSRCDEARPECTVSYICCYTLCNTHEVLTQYLSLAMFSPRTSV